MTGPAKPLSLSAADRRRAYAAIFAGVAMSTTGFLASNTVKPRAGLLLGCILATGAVATAAHAIPAGSFVLFVAALFVFGAGFGSIRLAASDKGRQDDGQGHAGLVCDLACTRRVVRPARVAPGASAFTASPWACNGHVFVLSEEGDTYVIEAADEYRLVRVTEAPAATGESGPSSSRPARRRSPSPRPAV